MLRECYDASVDPNSDTQEVRAERLDQTICERLDAEPSWKNHRRELSKRGASLWLRPTLHGHTVKDRSFAYCLQQRLRYIETSKSGIKCSGCNCSVLEPLAFMDHCLGCARRRGESATTRHTAVKRALHEFAQSCGFTVVNEPPLVGTEDERPDLLIERGDTSMYIDVTAFNFLAPTYVCRKSETVLKARYDEKARKYKAAAEADGAAFAVFGMTSLGSLTPESTSVIKHIAAEAAFPSDPNTAIHSIAAAVANANGRILAGAQRELRSTR